MEEKYFISIEKMEKHRTYDSIGDWLIDLERNRKNEENKDQKNKDLERIKKIEYLQDEILKNLSFDKLVWLAVMFSELKKEEHKQNLSLSNKIRGALDKKWINKINEDEEEIREK